MTRNQKRILRLRNHVLNHSKKENEPTEQPEKEEQEDTNAIAYDGMTKADISNLLSEKGIGHNSRDNKAELIELLIKG